MARGTGAPVLCAPLSPHKRPPLVRQPSQPKSGSAYTVWPVVHAELTRRRLKSLPPSTALNLQRAGKAVIVDCRPEYQFKKERIEGAINVPLFRTVQGSGTWDQIKKVVMAVGLAMTATGERGGVKGWWMVGVGCGGVDWPHRRPDPAAHASHAWPTPGPRPPTVLAPTLVTPCP